MKATMVVLTLAVLLLLTIIAPAAAGYDTCWHVVGAGGGHAEAGSYALDSTIGQAMVGTAAGDGFHLYIGFLPGIDVQAVELRQRVYLPLVLRDG